MKWYKYLLLSILLFICPKVNAAVCDNADKVNYQNLAKNITYSYDYIDSNNTFNVIFTNVDASLYFQNIDNDQIYNYTGNEMTLTGFNPGGSYKFGIYTNDLNCMNQKIYTIYVTIPFYNPYYTDKLCSGIENYKYCKKFMSKQITYDEFKNNITEYKNKLNQKVENDDSDKSKTIFDDIFNFYLEYYYIILPAIIIVCLIIRWQYNKRQDLF